VRRSHFRRTVAAVTLTATALTLAGCGGDDEEPSSDSTSPQAVAWGSTLDSTWPLTGLEVTGDESAAQDHPVIVTKIDNTTSSAPQVGLGSADMVVEELVEGGLTRLAVFFYSDLPDQVGPVRSMRASDIGIVSSTDATVVTSGASPRTIARIQGADISFVAEGAAGITRATDRSAPDNVMADLQTIADKIDQQDEVRPDDYLPWGEESDFPKGQKATSVTASFGGHTTEWKYQGDAYQNTNGNAGQGDEFSADNVLVLRVKVGDAGYLDPAGNPVPETQFEGKGEAMLFHGGQLVRGTWEKDALDGTITLSTKAGKLTVPAGHTWIELVPQDSGGVQFN
jgi:hypothetical protein